MKFLFILFTLVLPHYGFTQDQNAEDREPAYNEQDAFQDQYVEETSSEGNVYMNDAPSEVAANDRRQNQDDRIQDREIDRFQVDCNCPAPEEAPQSEVAENTTSIFPPGTAVNITPVPTDQNPASVQVKEREFPPAYVEKLPSGYSNNTFQPIGTSSQ